RAGAAGSPGRRPRRAARGPRRRIRWSGAQARTPDHRTDGGRSEVDLRLGCLILGRGTADAELGEDLLLDLDGELGVVPQEAASVFLALAELVPLVGEPGTGLAHDPVLHAEVDEPALPGDAPAVEDVELGLLERRGHLVLDDLGARAVADRLGALLEGLDAADVDTHRGVELQRLAAGGGLRGAEEHPDLLAQLVDEDRRGARGGQRTGDLAQRLGHEPGLQPD